MNRDYINWLESLPCNRKRQPVNQWMGEWAPLPEHIDLPRYEETQQRWIERDCRDGVMARVWRSLVARFPWKQIKPQAEIKQSQEPGHAHITEKVY